VTQRIINETATELLWNLVTLQPGSSIASCTILVADVSDERRQDSSSDRMMIAEPLNTSQKYSKTRLTSHVPISGFEELNTVRLATGISTSDLSGNYPLFPQNYTAWTTPTQLIKKKATALSITSNSHVNRSSNYKRQCTAHNGPREPFKRHDRSHYKTIRHHNTLH